MTLRFSGAAPPTDWGLGAWKVRQPYVASESHFDSDNATLNRVWELCRNTLDGGVIGTFTDSNTRERKPYPLLSVTRTQAAIIYGAACMGWNSPYVTMILTIK